MSEKCNFRDLLPNDVEELKDIIEVQKAELIATKIILNILKRDKHRIAPRAWRAVNASLLSTSRDYISVDFHYKDTVLKTIKKRWK